MSRRGDPKRFQHPGFRDMTGQLVQGPEGSENVNGNARWRCRHSCGGLVVLEGIRLRSSPPGYCEHCRPKRAGTVVRRAHQRQLFREPQPSVVFSDCGRYRWILWWPTGIRNERVMAVCGANPSVAGQLAPDGTMRSDPTVSRLRNLACELEFGWLCVVNARSWIATEPRDVPPDPDAIGADTDCWIETAARACELFVCAYGHLAGERGARVLEIVRGAGKVPHALALTQDGTPRHPRGVPSSARPFPVNTETRYTARTKRAVNSLTVERGPKAVPHE